MAVIVLQRWTDLHLNYILGASATITPPSSFTVALTTNTIASLTSRAAPWNSAGGAGNIQEIGGTSAAAYARQAIARTIAQAGVDFAASTFDTTVATGGTTMAADQVTFGAFSGAPNPNGANSFVMTDGTTLNAGQLYVAGDTAATRTFASGDTEKVTITIKSG